MNPANSESFAYTKLGQLKTAQGPYGTYSYAYDLTGNRIQEVKSGGASKTLNYPATSNRLQSESDGTSSRGFVYDGAGNMTQGLTSGPSYGLFYNKRNRPSGLTLNGSTVATYLFNAQEQLVSRTLVSPLTPAGVTHYIYDTEGHLMAEATGASAASAVITREYLWLEGLPLAVIDGVNTASPVTYYVHTDHLARPIRLTGAAKGTQWTASWLPHGGAYSITGSLTQNLRFPGQYFLIEQGLAYNWHRFYDPTTGRYTQPDPLGFPDGPARYAYVGNSPLMNVDPEGRKYNGIPTGTPSAADVEKAQQCAQQCLDNHLIEAIGGGVSAAGATPIPKKLLGYFVPEGASDTTNLISTMSHRKIKNETLGKLAKKLFNTKRWAGVAGRSNIGLAAGLCLYDALSISYCTKTCIESE